MLLFLYDNEEEEVLLFFHEIDKPLVIPHHIISLIVRFEVFHSSILKQDNLVVDSLVSVQNLIRIRIDWHNIRDVIIVLVNQTG